MQLADGPVTFTAHGSSMTPKIRSGDTVTVEPVDSATVKRGDIVLAKVKGSLYLHLVTATESDRVQISNNHGHVNGWTSRAQIYGRYVR
jgi:phage repressor protein C with HTH and peptisase S24 domain